MDQPNHVNMPNGPEENSETSAFDKEESKEKILRRERYKLFVEQSAYGFYEIDLSGNLTFFNNALCRIFGRTRQELENRNIAAFMSPEDGQAAIRNLEQLGATDRVIRRTWRITYRSGKQRILEVSIQPTFTLNGAHNGYRGILGDVTNKLHTQDALIKSRKKIQELYAISKDTERRYRSFLDFLPLPLIVQNLDYSLAYMNPAFIKTFGWTSEDLVDDPVPFIPSNQLHITRSGNLKLRQEGTVSGCETKRLTKDGRMLDVIKDSSVFVDHENKPAGYVVTLRDITRYKKNAETSQSIFKIAEALHHYNDLDELLTFISRQVQNLLKVEHTHLILVDYKQEGYYYRIALPNDPDSFKEFSKTRVPLDDSYFAGKIILSGIPRILNKIGNERTRLVPVDRNTYNMLGVPLKLTDKIIGTMVVTNKFENKFEESDASLLSSIANIVTLPIENARINHELRKSYEDIQSLNRAKDRIIDHLSHELRTPMAVLSASLGMLTSDECPDPDTAARLLARSKRNLNRLTEIQSKIVDITQDPDEPARQTLSALLELCMDELEGIAEIEGGPEIWEKMRDRFESTFTPINAPSEDILLGDFVKNTLEDLTKHTTDRHIDLKIEIIESNATVTIPSDALRKVITGLVRNAYEYTPDGGKITVRSQNGAKGPELIVTDTGVGITKENQRLIFGNYFTTADVSQYTTGTPFEFNAGGSGFDLLRIQVFAERYNFILDMNSERCRHIPTNEDICPGNTESCPYCETAAHCHETGGTCFTLQFLNTRKNTQ